MPALAWIMATLIVPNTAALTSWEAARLAGIRFYYTPEGVLHLHHDGIQPDQLADLRQHRATIVAQWLWQQPAPPSRMAWDAAIADAVLDEAVHLLAGPSFLPCTDWTPIDQAAEAVDAAYHRHDLPALVTAAQAWVLAVPVARSAHLPIIR